MKIEMEKVIGVKRSVVVCCFESVGRVEGAKII